MDKAAQAVAGKQRSLVYRLAMPLVLVSILAALCTVLVTGVSPPSVMSELLKRKVQALGESERQAIASGKVDIKTAREFYALFPSAQSLIRYYTGERGSPLWQSKVGLYGRYVLTLETDIQMNVNRTKIIKYGITRFQLVEVESVSPDDRSIRYNLQAKRAFGEPDWQRLIDAHGDFSSLGLSLKIDEPLPQFADFWKAF